MRWTNHLAGESSPYLAQHAHNPVDWRPWDEDALETARRDDKPVFLSIGYSACHWCHVMERESFEDEAVAELLNRYFVPIKVDREERPDLDAVYMGAVQALTGSGGWPLNVFLTPELKPFFGGTYFPQANFKELLSKIASLWRERRDDLARSAEALTSALQSRSPESAPAAGQMSRQALDNAVAVCAQAFDSKWGGFGDAPKFPSCGVLAALLREGHDARRMAELTLDKMAMGGICDQVGGGFHRYAVDRRWLVPHFEKMLYDNALLAQVYSEAWLLTKKPLYRKAAVGTLDYLLRDMRDPGGAFHASEDADSEGGEGLFYLWTPGEIIAALGEADGAAFIRHYGVTEQGNFEGRNLLNGIGMDGGELEAKLERVRALRPRPGKDDKILADWNGLAISALAKGHRAFGDGRYLDAALKAARFVEGQMQRDGELLHVFRAGVAKQPGFLDDYAFTLNARLDLFEASHDVHWLRAARNLADRMTKLFWDDHAGHFNSTSAQHHDLIYSPMTLQDTSVPSGNAIAALALFKLSRFLDAGDYQDLGVKVLRSVYPLALKYPLGFPHSLVALAFHLGSGMEVVVVGPSGDPGTVALLAVVNAVFLPDAVTVHCDPAELPELSQELPLLQGERMVDGKPTAYVCANSACSAPLHSAAELLKALT